MTINFIFTNVYIIISDNVLDMTAKFDHNVKTWTDDVQMYIIFTGIKTFLKYDMLKENYSEKYYSIKYRTVLLLVI